MPQVTCRILCIDDHDDTSEMLSLILSQEDFEVVTTRTIGEALQHARDGEFALYVLDKHLPDGSGLDLCAKLNEVTPGLPCLVYCGDAYALPRSEALAAGAHAYVGQPDTEGRSETGHELGSGTQCAP